MAAEIEARTGIAPTLIKGRGGIFQVRKDQALIYDKAQTGRFPEPGEILALLGA